MKLLLDQNLSHRMLPALCETYPDSTQVRFLDMEGAADKVIWDYARKHGYAVVTLDADFHEFSMLWGGPPLIIWLKCGNQRKEVLLDKLINSRESILHAAEDTDLWCLEVF